MVRRDMVADQSEMEIVTQFPYDGSFIRLAARMVDPALGVAVGWNHFVYQHQVPSNTVC